MDACIKEIFDKYIDCGYILLSQKYSSKLTLASAKDLSANNQFKTNVFINPIFLKNKKEFNISLNKTNFEIKENIDLVNYLIKYGFWGLKGNENSLNNISQNSINKKGENQPTKLSPLTKISICIPAEILERKTTGLARIIGIPLERLIEIDYFENIFLISNDPSKIKKNIKKTKSNKIKFINFWDIFINHFDILWVPHFEVNPWIIFLLKLKRTKIMLTINDFITYDNPSPHPNRFFWYRKRDLIKFFISFSDFAYCISEAIYIRSKIEFPNKYISWINPGIDHFKNNKNNLFLENKRERKYIFVIGTNYPHKNIEFAHRIWQSLVMNNFDIDIIYCGFGCENLEKDLLRKNYSTKINNAKAIFTTHQSEENIRNFYKNCIFSLYPTLSEGFGLIPYESAIYNTPCLFTSFGPLRELGEYVGAPKDWNLESYLLIAEKLITSENFRKEYVIKTINFSNKITWSKFMKNFENLIRLKINEYSPEKKPKINELVTLIIYFPIKLIKSLFKIYKNPYILSYLKFRNFF